MAEPQGNPKTDAPPPKKPNQKDDADAPEFEYRIGGKEAVIVVAGALIADFFNTIPFVGLVAKWGVAGLFAWNGVSPFMVYQRINKAAKHGPKAKEKLEKKLDEFEQEEDSKKGPMSIVTDAIIGPGVGPWIISYILDSLPIISFWPWTTQNTLAIIRESRKQDRMNARVDHFTDLYSKHDAEDAAWSRKFAAWRQRQIGRGPEAMRAMRNQQALDRLTGKDRSLKTRTEQKIATAEEWDRMSPEERDRLIRKGTSFSTSAGLNDAPRTFKNDKERKAYLAELSKKQAARGGAAVIGERAKAFGALTEEERKRQLAQGLAPLAGAAAAGALAGDALDQKALTDKARAEKEAEGAQVDGIVPGGPQETDDAFDSLIDEIDKDDLREAWDEYQDDGGTLGFDDYIRTRSPEELSEIEQKALRKSDLRFRSGEADIDGVVAPPGGPATPARDGAIFAGPPDGAPDAFPDERHYRRIEGELAQTINATIVNDIGISPETRAALKALRGGRLAGTLTNESLEVMKREIKNPKVVELMTSIRADYPTAALSEDDVRLIKNNPSIGSGIRFTAEEVETVPGAEFTDQQLSVIAEHASVPENLRIKVKGLRTEHATAQARTLDIERRFGTWIKDSGPKFDTIMNQEISRFEEQKRRSIIENGRVNRESDELFLRALERAETEAGASLEHRHEAIIEGIRKRLTGRSFNSRDEFRGAFRDALRDEVGRKGQTVV